MSDDMIKALAAKGGVIQINYEQNYLSDEYRKAYEANAGDVSKADEAFKKECGDDFICIGKAQQRQLQQLQAEGKLPRVSWEKSSSTSTTSSNWSAPITSASAPTSTAPTCPTAWKTAPSSPKSPKPWSAKATPTPTSKKS